MTQHMYVHTCKFTLTSVLLLMFHCCICTCSRYLRLVPDTSGLGLFINLFQLSSSMKMKTPTSEADLKLEDIPIEGKIAGT